MDIHFIAAADFCHGFKCLIEYIIVVVLCSISLYCHGQSIANIRSTIKSQVKHDTKLHIRPDGDKNLHGIMSQSNYITFFVSF